LLKIGLVGCGYLGSRHLKHLSSLEGVEVSRVWDKDPVALARAVEDFKLPPAGSLKDLLSRSDAVDVVTPTATHFEIGRQILEAGLPLFIEKPLCATGDEGARLVDLAAKAKLPIQVGHIERFNQAFRALQTLNIRSSFIEAHRLASWNPRGIDVAVVHDLMIHDLDLILTLAGEFPDAVYASGVGVVTDSVDIANARLEFPGGLVANVTASRISLKQMRKLRIFASNAYITLDFSHGTCEYVGVSSTKDAIPDQALIIGEMGEGERKRCVHRSFPYAEEGDALRLELESFRDAILAGTTPRVTGEDALRALKLAELVVDRITGNAVHR
jgi:predicted dehydrogenase